ncbi:hypothetical protein ROZALSC1DRAFT_12899 [Rozella allomycis CSF55]|uniref:EamA domain-containing protein n=1 Tax=Rozella allomycis (strain CSF55) TaxID=988480 RepID=A0A4P9YLC1_ROZAC|nr:hypothetical protein ROZALSC1DRAFT_12899 [Rozella allomycis CSF55]
MSSIFTLILSIPLKIERATFFKVIAAIITIASAGLLCLDTESNHPMGIIFALLCAFAFSCYSVLLRKLAPQEDRLNTVLLFGLVGVINLLTLWPFMFILHYMGVETLEIPPKSVMIELILTHVICTFPQVYFLIYAQKRTSPVVVSIGMGMSIPLSIVGNILINNEFPTPMMLISGICALVGFVFVNLAEFKPKWDEIIQSRITSFFHKNFCR